MPERGDHVPSKEKTICQLGFRLTAGVGPCWYSKRAYFCETFDSVNQNMGSILITAPSIGIVGELFKPCGSRVAM